MGNTSFATASPLGAADMYVASAKLASATDAHYFSVDVGSGAIGRRLRIETRAGDPLVHRAHAAWSEEPQDLVPPGDDLAEALDRGRFAGVDLVASLARHRVRRREHAYLEDLTAIRPSARQAPPRVLGTHPTPSTW